MNKPKFPWMIRDWAGNEIFGTRNGLNVELRFETADDAEEHLQNMLGDAYATDREEYVTTEVGGAE